MLHKKISEIIFTLLLIGMFMSLFYIVSVKSESRTWIVDDDGPADFHTIQEGINAANLGDTIYVKAGTYYECLFVGKSLSLIGENRNTTTIDAQKEYGSENAVWIEAKDVKVSGFTIRNVGNRHSGILVIGTPSVITSCVISNNKVVNNTNYAIFLQDAPFTTVSGNMITNNGIGLFVGSPRDDNDTIMGNIIANNTEGIVFQGGNDNLVSKNMVMENGKGIHLDTYGGRGQIIKNNNLLNNEHGIYLYCSSNNTIYHNNFINNTKQVYDYWWGYPELSVGPYVNSWDSGYPSGGNYWSDYKGTDLYSGPNQNETNHDWIGDSAYIIDENNQDNYPLMDPYVPETEEARIEYRKLLEKYNNLNLTYDGLIASYVDLQRDFSDLNATYYNLKAGNENLQVDFNALNTTYYNLGSAYDELRSKQEATVNELNSIRKLTYALMATTIIFIVATVYYAKRKPTKGKYQSP